MRNRNDNQAISPVAGRGVNLLSVWAMSSLGLFVAVVVLLVAGNVFYVSSGLLTGKVTGERLWEALRSGPFLEAAWRSLYSSLITLVLVMAVSVPVGLALSRYRFPGHALVNTLVDLPIVLPPLMVGVSLLALLGMMGDTLRGFLEDIGLPLDSVAGIILCQFIMAIPYAVRATKAAFDAVEPSLEHVAMTLGCGPGRAFLRVTLPLARHGVLAGGVVAWARAIGVFAPIQIFVGVGPRVMVIPTTIWQEINNGQAEVAIAGAMVMILLAGVALALVHALESRAKGGRP